MSNLVFKHLEPRVKVANPPLLIMLHGYGSNEADLFSFADELNDRFLVVSVRAPKSLSFGGYAWYDIDFTGSSSRFGNPEQALESLEQLRQFVIEIQKRFQTNPKQTVLLGFSQGAILSYALSLRYPELISKVLALSGYIFNEILPKQINTLATAHLEYFISHGTQDEVIPIQWARASEEWLTKMNLRHEYKEYAMGHGINPHCFSDMMTWISARYPLLTSK